MAEAFRTCPWCGTEFMPRRNRWGVARARCCSPLCSRRLANSHRAGSINGPWRTEEEEVWLDFNSRHSFFQAMGYYNRWAARNGLTVRSEASLRHALRRLGASARPDADGWNSAQLEEMLGISQTRIISWIEKGLVPRRLTRRRLSIYRKDLVRLASTRPELFGGIDADRLFSVFEDRELADRIARDYPRPLRHARIVERSDGRRFRSVAVAAHIHGVDRRKFYQIVQRGRFLDGYCFRFVSEPQVEANVS